MIHNQDHKQHKFIKPPVAVAFLVLPYTQWRFCFQGLFPSHKWGHNNQSVNFICSNYSKFWEVSSSPGTLKGKKKIPEFPPADGDRDQEVGLTP